MRISFKKEIEIYFALFLQKTIVRVYVDVWSWYLTLV